MKQVSAIKFEPIQKTKIDDDGKEIKLDLYKGTTFEEVVEFLTEKGTD